MIDLTEYLGVEDFGQSTNNPQLLNTTIVNPGESLIVKPGVWHRFYVIKSGKVVEVYWTTDGAECDANDIVRLDTGGKR